MTHLINVDDLTITYKTKGGMFTALHSMSMTIDKGQIVGVVGESGAGKSTIGKAMLGILDESATIAEGTITMDGQIISNQPEQFYKTIRGHRIGYIYQNPMTALNPVLTVGEQIIETIEKHTNKKGDIARKYAIELLEGAEVPMAESRLNKYPHQMSGGLCQRIVFAIAIAANPDLIIADEPTTALDVTVQKAVLQTLKNMVKKHDIAIMLITHDMGVIAEMCDYVYVLRYGKLLEHNTTKDILLTPQVDYTQTLMRSIPRVDEKIHRFQVPAPIVGGNRDRAIAYLKNKQDIEPPTKGPLLSVRKVSKTFVKKGNLFRKTEIFTALKDINFDVMAGETLGIIGESGSGKSTVGRVILGLHQGDDGSQVLYKGQDITTITSATDRIKHCLSLQCIFQDPYSSLNPRMSAGENIVHALKTHGLLSAKDADQLASDLMELVGLRAEDVHKKPHHFSGGERQRIGIARALSFRPDFLFCDEPTSALDVTVQAELLNLMKDLQEELGLTMLFVSHDLAVIRQMCDRVMIMKDGQVVEIGQGENVFTNPQSPYTQSLLASMPKFNFAVPATKNLRRGAVAPL